MKQPRSLPVPIVGPPLAPTLPPQRAASSGDWRLPPSRTARNAATSILPMDFIVTGLMVLVVAGIYALSAAMLTNWKIHYLTTGGAFFEKLHPATYAALLSFIILLFRNGNPIGEIDRMLSGAKLLLLYLLFWSFLLIQMFVLERPFTVIIDTFLLPLLLCLIIWRLSPAQKRPLVWTLHVAILLNVILGYYEYFSGHRLFPLSLGGDVVVVGEWRSSALLGHPLTASGIVAAYILALVLRPRICPTPMIRLPLIAFCLGSLMAFGGRTALVFVLVVLGTMGAIEMLRMLRGGRTSLPTAIAAICVLFVAVAVLSAAFDLGIFDKMLLRFSSDKGSAHARVATVALLSHFDLSELLLGPNQARVSALQSQLGLAYGIENFWIASTVQFGAIHTALLSIGLISLFVEIYRRSARAVIVIFLLIAIIAASSVSFSSKNIQLAQFVVLIALLLPRDRLSTSPPVGHRRTGGGAYRPEPA